MPNAGPSNENQGTLRFLLYNWMKANTDFAAAPHAKLDQTRYNRQTGETEKISTNNMADFIETVVVSGTYASYIHLGGLARAAGVHICVLTHTPSHHDGPELVTVQRFLSDESAGPNPPTVWLRLRDHHFTALIPSIGVYQASNDTLKTTLLCDCIDVGVRQLQEGPHIEMRPTQGPRSPTEAELRVATEEVLDQEKQTMAKKQRTDDSDEEGSGMDVDARGVHRTPPVDLTTATMGRPVGTEPDGAALATAGWEASPSTSWARTATDGSSLRLSAGASGLPGRRCVALPAKCTGIPFPVCPSPTMSHDRDCTSSRSHSPLPRRSPLAAPYSKGVLGRRWTTVGICCDEATASSIRWGRE